MSQHQPTPAQPARDEPRPKPADAPRPSEKDKDEEEAVVLTPQEAFVERHRGEVREVARELDARRKARAKVEPDREMRTLEYETAKKDDDKAEVAGVNSEMYHEVMKQKVGDVTRLAEMRRGLGEYPGRFFTVDPDELNKVKTLEVSPHGDLDVVDAAPQGLSSRHQPTTRQG